MPDPRFQPWFELGKRPIIGPPSWKNAGKQYPDLMGESDTAARSTQYVVLRGQVLTAPDRIRRQTRPECAAADELVDALGQQQISDRVERLVQLGEEAEHLWPVASQIGSRGVPQRVDVIREPVPIEPQRLTVDDVARADRDPSSLMISRIRLDQRRQWIRGPKTADEPVQLRVMQRPLELVPEQRPNGLPGPDAFHRGLR
jgi:hypothetical protein